MLVSSDEGYKNSMKGFIDELFDMVDDDKYSCSMLMRYQGIMLFSIASTDKKFEGIYTLSPLELMELINGGKVKLQCFSRKEYEEFVEIITK